MASGWSLPVHISPLARLSNSTTNKVIFPRARKDPHFNSCNGDSRETIPVQVQSRTPLAVGFCDQPWRFGG